MKRFELFLFLVLSLVPLFVTETQAQNAGPAAPPAITETTLYLLPPDLRAKIRDAQFEWDELEIDNQKMLVRAKENKARQDALMADIMKIATQAAQDKKIDLKVYELDSKTLKFRPRPIPIVDEKKGK